MSFEIAHLVMFYGDAEPRAFPLKHDTTVIGRREDCDLRIPLGVVSRKHCKLVRTDGGYSVEDLGSSNGTFVNGHRVQQMELEAGDTVQIGSVAFVLQLDNDPAIEEMHPITVAPAADIPPAGPADSFDDLINLDDK
jgi:pSer/pThr/pTyr-binding forkhead associated (FHA) protein